MSLYNLLHGQNVLTPILLSILQIDQERDDRPEWPKNDEGEDWDPDCGDLIPAGQRYIKKCIETQYWVSGRFRDIYLNGDGTKIILYTRNGGGNRDAYYYIFDVLREHPNYISDYDDEFDCTYAYLEFSIPEKAKRLCKSLATGDDPKTISQMFLETIAEMKKMKPEDFMRDKRFKSLVDIVKSILED